VTFDDGPTSPNQATGGFSRVFDKAGTYPYHCVNHPGMTGSVTVK
jgi:plastocyanin